MSILSSLFKRVIRLNEGDDSPPWQFHVWDDAAQVWRSLGGSGSSSSLLYLPADPPDFVTVNGETISVEGR